MRIGIPALVFLALFLFSAQAQAKSCSGFALFKSYDADADSAEVSWVKGKSRKYFPKPQGSPTDTSKIPGKCNRKITKTTTFVVKATGGRMTATQVRSNFQGKMRNDLDDSAWLPATLKDLIDNETKVVIVVRPGMAKDAPLGITTVYLPITDEELAEIKRLEDQAEDL